MSFRGFIRPQKGYLSKWEREWLKQMSDYIPTREHAHEHRTKRRNMNILRAYLDGESLMVIAVRHKISRTRVEQITHRSMSDIARASQWVMWK